MKWIDPLLEIVQAQEGYFAQHVPRLMFACPSDGVKVVGA
jgi:hypothetical protein